MAAAKPKILMVDDVQANLIALDAALARLDAELVPASSGNEALKLLLRHEFAVMLLDVQMAEMDGYEVARLARSNPTTAGVPIIFVSAMHETEANALAGYGAGAVDFIFKPFNPEILISKVRVFLDLYQSRRQLELEVAAHKETLAELDAFNYSVSHDLRAPLRPVEGFSQALLEDYGDRLDEKGLNYLKRIRGAAQRMSQLIDDLLQLSRLTRSAVTIGKVNLVELANGIVADLRALEPQRNVEFVTMNEAIVEGDARLLKIVLENLLRNAWKFTQKKELARIELGVRSENDRTVYFVRDNGAGFDPAHARRMFQPFQRMHTPAEFEGTGIGLAIVQRIIKRHGGTVWADAAVEQGATISFTLGA